MPCFLKSHPRCCLHRTSNNWTDDWRMVFALSETIAPTCLMACSTSRGNDMRIERWDRLLAIRVVQCKDSCLKVADLTAQFLWCKHCQIDGVRGIVSMRQLISSIRATFNFFSDGNSSRQRSADATKLWAKETAMRIGRIGRTLRLYAAYKIEGRRVKC